MSSLRCPCCGWLWDTEEKFADHRMYMTKFGMWPEERA